MKKRELDHARGRREAKTRDYDAMKIDDGNINGYDLEEAKIAKQKSRH